MVNVVAVLRAQFDAQQRGLFSPRRGAFFRFIAGTAGFREWWERRGIHDDREFAAYIDSLGMPGAPDTDDPGASEPAA